MELIPKRNALMQLYLKTQQRQSTPPTRVRIFTDQHVCTNTHSRRNSHISKGQIVSVRTHVHTEQSLHSLSFVLSLSCVHTPPLRACSFKSVWWKLTWATAPSLCWTARPSGGSAPGSDRGRVADSPGTRGSQFFWARPSLSASLHAIR